jgi:hypothetical protein
MKRTKNRTYTLREVNNLKDGGFVIRGVVFDEELVSIDGMRFTLIDEDQGLGALIFAEGWLTCQRDVVGAILIAELEKCPFCGLTEEEVGFDTDGPEQLICKGCNGSFHTNNWYEEV